MLLLQQHNQNSWVQTSKTGGQQCNNNTPHKATEYSLHKHLFFRLSHLANRDFFKYLRYFSLSLLHTHTNSLLHFHAAKRASKPTPFWVCKRHKRVERIPFSRTTCCKRPTTPTTISKTHLPWKRGRSLRGKLRIQIRLPLPPPANANQCWPPPAKQC